MNTGMILLGIFVSIVAVATIYVIFFRNKLILPPKAGRKPLFYVYCPKKKSYIGLTNENTRIQPHNPRFQKLVIDCTCGETHHAEFIFGFSDSVIKQEKRDLAKHNFKSR